MNWTAPTSTEIGVVVKSGIAAGLAWLVAGALTGVGEPVLAPLTALGRRAGVRALVGADGAATQRGGRRRCADRRRHRRRVDARRLHGGGARDRIARGRRSWSCGFLPPRPRQVPVSLLVVLTALAANDQTSSWRRVVDTVVGAAVGVAVSLVLPASRRTDARQTLTRLGEGLGGVLDAMAAGLEEPWTADQSSEWRLQARTTRERLVAQTVEAVGNSREAARWNVRDRRHVDELARYEEMLPRLERTAIGVSVIARGLDDHARLGGATHPAMPAMGALLGALADLVRALLGEVLGSGPAAGVAESLGAVRARRVQCARGAGRRAQPAVVALGPVDEQVEGEWLNYAAILVQVDRIVADLSAPAPSAA